MNIIIAGDGKVGANLAARLTADGYDITLIDNNQAVLSASVNDLDVIAVHGNCASVRVLQEAGVMDADLLIAVTHADEVNLLCCTTAHGLNPKLHTIARIRNPEYADQVYTMGERFGLSMAINPEGQTAEEIERLLKYPGFLRRDVFAKGRAEIVELRLDEDSKLCGLRLVDLSDIFKCRVLVCAVLRNGTAVVPNSGDFAFREGDRIFVTAPATNLTKLLRSLGIITRRARKVTLCGGGRVSQFLAARLLKSGVAVQIIEKEYARCKELCELLPDATVIHGDCGHLSLLESEGIAEQDAIVTATGRDELNMIVSLYAESVGIKQIITKLSHGGDRNVMDALNLGSTLCPKDLVVNEIVRYVRAMQNQVGAAVSVHSIADGLVEAMEFLVDENTINCNVPLKELKPKDNVLIASITRGYRTEIPNGDSFFRKGDTLVVVTTQRGAVRQINDIFA